MSTTAPRTNFEPADIGAVVEVTLNPWGRPGTIAWSSFGGATVGRVKTYERAESFRPLVAPPQPLGTTVIAVEFEGRAEPLRFPASAVRSIERFEVSA